MQLKPTLNFLLRQKFFLVMLIVILATSVVETAYMRVASLAYLTMVAGFVLRRAYPKVHIRLMSAAMCLDLLVVLVLEIQRDAVHTALSFTLNPLQQAHIAASSTATILYIPVILLGVRKFSPKLEIVASARKWHKYLGIAAFVFRSLGFVLMFSMLMRH
jgi:hypothetical protein